MKKIYKYFNRRSLMGYIILICTIITVLVLIMGSYTYRFYYTTIESDFEQDNKAYLSSVVNRHENDLMIIDDIVAQVSLSRKNTEFKLNESPMKSISLKEQLYRYSSVSNFFDLVFYFYQEDKYLYNGRTSIELNLFHDRGIIYEYVPRKEINALLYNKESSLKVLKEQYIRGYLADLNYGQGVTYFKTIEPRNDSVMIFIVSKDYYDGLLQVKDERLRNNFIISNGEIIVSRGNLEIDNEKLLQQLNENETEQFQIELEGEKYIVTQQKGKSELVYCSIQSMKIFQSKVVSNQWGIFLILFLCAMLTFFAIVYIAKGLSRKVKKISYLLDEGGQNYYDLEYIENEVRALVDENNEAKEDSLLFRKHRFINRFIEGEYIDEKSAIDAGNRVGISIKNCCFVVVLVSSSRVERKNLSHKIILNEMERESLVDGFGIFLVLKNQELFVIFSENVLSLKGMLDQLFNVGSHHYNDFTMAVSGCHKTYSEASKAYLEADTAFEHRFLVDNSKIIHFDGIVREEKVVHAPDVYIDRIKSAMRVCDKEGIEKIVLEICKNLQINNYSLLSFRILYNNIITMLVKECNVINTEVENIYSIFSISKCLTVQEFNMLLCKVCFTIMEDMQAANNKRTAKTKEAIEYMKENYRDSNLNMSFLARHLEISQTTLATEFKNDMGVSPSDYLGIMRIEKAKELLSNTELLVKEVCVEVGYEDVIVFTRRFKKYVGKTPGQYRKR